MKISGRIIDVHNRTFYNGSVNFENGRIVSINADNTKLGNYILPGFIDSHIHIESSMITPKAFAAAAVPRGTIGVISDPHEIANVLGIEGVRYMIRSGEQAPFYFWFGASSCVPATSFETSGSTVSVAETEELLKDSRVLYLSEMMNWPGVIYGNRDVLEKIEIAKRYKKPIDGHAPELRGEALRKYIEAGISTDHECSTITEALEKISLGMKVLIREGSAARNLDSLKELIRLHPDMVMICSDDLHPEMLKERHISRLVADLVKEGYDLFNVLRAVTVNPVEHYNLECGLLREGDPADFIVVENLAEMDVCETWIKGYKVFDNGAVNFDAGDEILINKFNCRKIITNEIRVRRKPGKINVIEAFDGELYTRKLVSDLPGCEFIECDTGRDILKIVVKDRYENHPPSVAFIKGMGLKRGAFGGTVSHDSHNIICVGTNDADIVNCVNKIVESEGGLAVSDDGISEILPLEIAGLMSVRSCSEVAAMYEDLSKKVKQMGSGLVSPFMTLSFMALLVIPEIKLSDKGLFDGKEFRLISLFDET